MRESTLRLTGWSLSYVLANFLLLLQFLSLCVSMVLISWEVSWKVSFDVGWSDKAVTNWPCWVEKCKLQSWFSDKFLRFFDCLQFQGRTKSHLFFQCCAMGRWKLTVYVLSYCKPYNITVSLNSKRPKKKLCMFFLLPETKLHKVQAL